MVLNRFNEEFNRKAQTFNTAIKAICKNLKVLYLFHNNIMTETKTFSEMITFIWVKKEHVPLLWILNNS